MRRSIFCSTSSTILFLYLAFVLFTTSAAWAAPGFDLDLKELKKPSQPAAPKKTAPPKKRKSEAKAVTKKHPAVVESKPASTQPETSLSSPPQATSEPSELVLHRGDNACQLAERIAVALARTVPTELLLNGLDLKPVSTVNQGQLDLMVTCRLPDAEAYTYSRLLSEHLVELVNIRGDETAGQTVQKVIDALALSYQQEPSNNGTLIYLFPADAQRQRPLRLAVQP